MHRRLLGLLIALSLFGAGCASADSPSGSEDPIDPALTRAQPVESENGEQPVRTNEVDEVEEVDAGNADIAEPLPPEQSEVAIELLDAAVTWSAGINQIAVLSDTSDVNVTVTAADGASFVGTTDAFGSLLFRDLPAGDYIAEYGSAAPAGTYDARYNIAPAQLAVANYDDAHPQASFYESQQIDPGFGYIETRDGTTLSANVSLPPGDGPFPTVVEYSGYGPSNPDDPSFATLFTALGYAYVGVNMRGTGCSGGSFEYFEPMQLIDGYDMVEAIAAQSWVRGNKVGLVGISYPGISQLYVASTQPPSLAAITPLSVLDDATLSTLYPGGILNTGFAKSWSDERESDSAPFGQGWEQGLVDDGDLECEANQLLRLQNTDAAALIEENAFYTPELSDPLAPRLFVPDIEVPVFLAGAWQDEQTGGHFPAMLDQFTSSRALFATMTNGSHTESLANPAIFERYVEFLDLYVAKRTPDLGSALLASTLLQSGLTGSAAPLPTGDRFEGMSYDEALAAFERDPQIRILFEDGASSSAPAGTPAPRYEAGFDAWPIPEAELVTWYLGDGGRLTDVASELAPADSTPSSWTSDPDSVPDTFYDGGSSGIWAANVELAWEPIPAGTGVEFITAPFADDRVFIGFGSLDLWLRSTAEDTDLEVTVSEVRPDGTEVYVQSGWLRASHRALDGQRSLANMPVHTHAEVDYELLPPGEFVEARVEIFPFAHAFRAGTRLRVTVDAPGGARPLWAFDSTIADGETNEIAHDADRQSKLVLAAVPGIDVPSEPPACIALRSQPCRSWVPLTNAD